MPDTCDEPQVPVLGPRLCSVTPTQSPEATPHCPAVACPTLSVPIARTQPSVHHGLPDESIAIMCGVRPDGGTAWTANSMIALPLPVSTYATFAVVSVFSVNHTKFGWTGSLPVMPYGSVFAVGVGKSWYVWVTGSNCPTADV